MKAKNGKIDVSIVVPVYNGQDTIDSCVKSLLETDYPQDQFEIIVVNNNSNDKTLEILEAYKKDISIIHENRRGPSAARNAGILNARGKYIAFTDADCIVDKQWLANIIKPLQRKKIGIVGGKTSTVPGSNHIEQFCEKLHDHSKSLKRKRPRAVSLNWASRKEVLQEQGMFDEDFIRAQDTELSFRISQAGYKFEYAPKAIVYHKEASTYKQLFHKGYLSGCYAINFYKKHSSALRKLGHKRFNKKVYSRIVKNLINVIKGEDVNNSKCFVVFQIGRIFGRVNGWMKFKHFEL